MLRCHTEADRWQQKLLQFILKYIWILKKILKGFLRYQICKIEREKLMIISGKRFPLNFCKLTFCKWSVPKLMSQRNLIFMLLIHNSKFFLGKPNDDLSASLQNVRCYLFTLYLLQFSVIVAIEPLFVLIDV